MHNFTHPIIKGIPHENILPKGIGLVLEGGGTRGFFSAGVFEAFMEAGVIFPYIASVSAGSANAFSYISGQRRRSRLIIEKYVGDSRYVGFRNILRHGTMFGYDFIFSKIPKEHVFFDHELFRSTDIRFLTGAVDCHSGETVWFEKHELSEDFKELIASCSVPLVARVVKHNSRHLLDGGVTTPIPIEKSMADGNNFHVIVLTRNKGYRQSPLQQGWLIRLFYKKYPKLVKALEMRHEIYNRQIELCEQLEKEGKAIIIRPQQPLAVGRTTKDTTKLLTLHDEGYDEGRKVVDCLLARLTKHAE
ncbi:MAG: patatin family protein [Defluviitaleaceae bacterium]|nr:patatin family protein [Defluviitaleaceae bacterium]